MARTETFLEEDVFQANLRGIELLARLLLLASITEGFTLQTMDVHCIGALLARYADGIKKSIKEVE